MKKVDPGYAAGALLYPNSRLIYAFRAEKCPEFRDFSGMVAGAAVSLSRYRRSAVLNA